jgi:glycosyltransferase involved in cell wall biosynthesis
MKLSLLFTTYNSPRWLQKVFWSVLEQDHPDFEVVVADDGSEPETAALIEANRPQFEAAGIPLTHVWQRDDGFRKCRILNKALLRAKNEYIVFTDGDCVLRKDFLSVHAAAAEPGHYLSGTYFKLPMETSEAISQDDIVSQRCFDRSWLVAHGLEGQRGRLKLTKNARFARVLNRTTTVTCNLKGSNASAWKTDLLGVGGMDERLESGGQDRELGVRLHNFGVKPRHVRFSAICLHLDHPRGYRNAETVKAIREHRLKIDREGTSRTEHGTAKLEQEGYGAEMEAAAAVTSEGEDV